MREVMAEAPRVLVVGGTGAVGQHVCHEVVRTLGADALVVGDHNAARGAAFAGALDRRVRSCQMDVHNRESIAHALDQLDGGDAVIVTVRQATPMVQELCTARGIHSVDIVPDTPLLRPAPPVRPAPSGEGGTAERGALCGVGAAGFIPGLSGLMAKAAIEQACCDRALPGDLTVHVALLQRKDGTAGATGIADMLGLFATPVEYEGRQVRGFTRTRVAPFPHPFGDRVVRLAAFPEAADVHRFFGVAHAYYWTAFDDEFFNRTVSAANRLGILKRFRKPGGGRRLATFIARGKSTQSGVEERVALTAEAHNTVVRLEVPSDYTGTAMAAVAMARELCARGCLDYGAVFPFELFSLEQIVARIGSPQVRVDCGDLDSAAMP